MDQPDFGYGHHRQPRGNDEAEGKGFGLVLNNGHLGATLVQRWLDDGVRLESEEPCR